MSLDRHRSAIAEHRAVIAELDGRLPEVSALADRVCAALAAGGKLVTFGNGGSAADAQHFATELVGHFLADRRPLAALALTTDTSALTAIGNDYAFEEIFARQVEALVGPGDVVVGISTSGESENVVRGLAAARRRGASTAALCGRGGRVAELADIVLSVPSETTARIQEAHMLIIHLVCQQVDEWAHAGQGERG